MPADLLYKALFTLVAGHSDCRRGLGSFRQLDLFFFYSVFLLICENAGKLATHNVKPDEFPSPLRAFQSNAVGLIRKDYIFYIHKFSFLAKTKKKLQIIFNLQ